LGPESVHGDRRPQSNAMTATVYSLPWNPFRARGKPHSGTRTSFRKSRKVSHLRWESPQVQCQPLSSAPAKASGRHTLPDLQTLTLARQLNTSRPDHPLSFSLRRNRGGPVTVAYRDAAHNLNPVTVVQSGDDDSRFGVGRTVQWRQDPCSARPVWAVRSLTAWRPVRDSRTASGDVVNEWHGTHLPRTP
jgi:hypothetical protein